MRMLINLTALLGLICFLANCSTMPSEIQTYGTMHKAIGQNRSEGRVAIADLIKKSNYNGVGALEGLKGEVTFLDGQAIITEVSANGKPSPSQRNIESLKATMFVGSQISEWVTFKLNKPMSRIAFEKWLKSEAKNTGFNTDQPFVFKLKGELSNVRMHVINGACPVHARINNKPLPPGKHAFEHNLKKVEAIIVGIYAEDAVGKLTHPDTSIHSHIVYSAKGEDRITGHLEDFTLGDSVTLMLPKKKR